jgi:hypothetical protein
MRRTHHRRRYHTGRIIRNRQRQWSREGWADDWYAEHPMTAGRLDDRQAYFGCGNAHCYLCHWDKFVEPRRTREKRAWKAEADDQIYNQDS